MLSTGNGDPQVCVSNLLHILRGECPYERLKGIDGDLIGSPSKTAANELIDDATWVIETYEPRVEITEIDISQVLNGSILLAPNVIVRS